jgi:hypothetical protein
MTTQMYEDPRDIRGANFAAGDEAVVAGEEFVDYFGFGRDEVFALPDGKQEIFFKVMNEGHELILSSVTGWSLRRRGPQGWDVVPFSTGGANSALAQWLKVADPKIVDDLELAIRRANPWMQADMSVEEIDKEIERLQDLRKEVEARELGK